MKKTVRAVLFALCLLISSQGFATPGPVSLTVYNGSVQDVLNAVGNISGRSIVTDGDIKGTISIDVHDVSFETAMDMICRAKGLAYNDVNGVVIVSAPGGNAGKGGNVEIYKLNYAKAEEVQKALTPIMTDGGKISVDAVTNSILFAGSPLDGNKVRNAVKLLDVVGQQVTLEAKIISINKDDAKELGVTWNWNTLYNPDDDNGTEPDNIYYGTIKYGAGYNFRFGPTLNALFSAGKAKILATPSVVTIPGKQASIFIGDHIPVLTEKITNGETTTTTEYVDAGIKLSYTPIVSDDGLITSVVHTEVSTPILISELKNYKITSRSADTNVRMRNGETLVIGGLINDEETRTVKKVPILSNIPIIGELFKDRIHNKTKTEVLMLLTPYLSNAGESPAIYNNRGKELEKQFKDFDDENFIKDVKKGEKYDAEQKLKNERARVKNEMTEVQREYAAADAKEAQDKAALKNSTSSSTASTSSTTGHTSMRERVDQILNH
jgi:type II secretory pathway component GspD/PulD (secretin)